MKCCEVQQRIKTYLDGELPAQEAEIIRRHINDCSFCLKEATLLSNLWELLLDLPDPERVPDLVPATLSRILAEPDTSFLQNLAQRLLPIPVPAVATVALVVGLFMGARLGTLISAEYTETREVEDPLYLEVFQDLPPQSVGDAYIKVNYAKGD